MTTGIDTSPKAITQHIFHQTYLYAIPGYYRYSKEYNEKVGHLSSGDKNLDRRMMNEYVNVGGTIEDILRLFEKGADIRFQTPTDLVTIYEVLITHLNNWSAHLANDPNVKNAPIDSLQLMSEFCEAIRPTVIGYKPRIEDVPKLNFIQSMFADVGLAEELFNVSGVGVEVKETPTIVNRIEELLAERHKNKPR